MVARPQFLGWDVTDRSKVDAPDSLWKSSGFDETGSYPYNLVNYFWELFSKTQKYLESAIQRTTLVVGTSAQVSDGIADTTVDSLETELALLSAGDIVRFLQGTHTLSANLTLDEANIVYLFEEGAVIDLNSSYTVEVSGSSIEVYGANFTNSPATGLTISGTGSIVSAQGLTPGQVSISNNALCKVTSENGTDIITDAGKLGVYGNGIINHADSGIALVPALSSNEQIITESATQTLQNKTLDNPSFTSGSGGLVPVGTLIASLSEDTPAGWLEVDGSVLSASVFPELANVWGSYHGYSGGITGASADAGTDVITSVGHGLADDTPVVVAASGGTLPSGLSATALYYIVNRTNDTFQLSLSVGGSAVDITSSDTLDVATNYHMPDPRDRFLRTLDTATGRTVGDTQEDALQNITGSVAIPRFGTGIDTLYGHTGALYQGPDNVALDGFAASGTPNSEGLHFDASLVARTATETRSKNMSVRWLVRYQ